MTRRWAAALITMVVGCLLLATSLSPTSVSPVAFFTSTTTLAIVWTVGAAAATAPLRPGRFPLGNGTRTRAAILGAVTGAALAAVFVVGGLVVRPIPLLHDAVAAVTAHAHQGTAGLVVIVTLVNGVGEEIFFRGALYELWNRHHPIATTTLAYTLVTATTGNAMLAFAAFLLGLCCALQRRATTGLLAPILTHIVWSSVMITVLPRLF